MFGRFFHSLTAHAASMFRIISLRSLNTEQHDRVFQQSKAITKGTSNNHPEHVISNIIQRLAFKQGTEKVIACQESGIKLAVGPMENTVFFPIPSCKRFQSITRHIWNELVTILFLDLECGGKGCLVA